jgi:hypothetical protein
MKTIRRAHSARFGDARAAALFEALRLRQFVPTVSGRPVMTRDARVTTVPRSLSANSGRSPAGL